MNKLVFATLSIGALMISVAKAADLPRKAAPAPVVAAPACAQFGGFYIGVQGGFVTHRHEFTNLDSFGSTTSGHAVHRRTNGHVGPQAGWNWQWNCTVFGVHADWSWSGGRHENSFRALDTTLTHEHRTRWFATARARTGVVVDNLLLYVTGGAAFAQHRNEHAFVVAPVTDSFSHSRTRFGFVVGAGTEWAFGSNWSFNSEFSYMAFERDSRAFACTTVVTCGIGVPVGTPFRFEHHNDAWVGRVGLNYRFGGGGPVVGRF